MRILALILSVWAGSLNADIVGFWELNNSLADSSGNEYTAVEVGTNTFVTSPSSCDSSSHMVGPFTTTKYLKGPSGFGTAMAGDSSFTIEMYVYANSFTGVPSGFPILFEFDGSPQCLLGQISNTGALRTTSCLASICTSTPTMSINTCYFVWFTYDGTNVKAGFSPADTIDSTADCDTVYGSWTVPDPTEFSFGASISFGQAFDGYIDDVKVRNTTETSFPTADPVSSSTQPIRIGPSLGLDRELSLLERFFNLITSPIHASEVRTQKGEYLKREAVKTKSDTRLREFIKREYVRGRVTATITPTPSRATHTPTVTPTPVLMRAR